MKRLFCVSDKFKNRFSDYLNEIMEPAIAFLYVILSDFRFYTIGFYPSDVVNNGFFFSFSGSFRRDHVHSTAS